jgi:hypothetical protein
MMMVLNQRAPSVLHLNSVLDRARGLTETWKLPSKLVQTLMQLEYTVHMHAWTVYQFTTLRRRKLHEAVCMFLLEFQPPV